MIMSAIVNDYRKSFGRLLEKHRTGRGLTFREFGDLLKMNFSHLNRMEAGERNPPDREKVIEMARKLGASQKEFLEAAGYLSPEEPAAHPNVIEWPGGVDPRTDDEKRTMAEAEALGMEFPQLSEPGFWEMPPEERRGLFRDIEGAIEETRRIYKQIGKKMPGEKA